MIRLGLDPAKDHPLTLRILVKFRRMDVPPGVTIH